MRIFSGNVNAPSRGAAEFSLFKSNMFYNIPKFQRPYSWTRLQRMNLIQAVEETLNPYTPLYPLPEILLQGEQQPVGQSVYEVGDGQQRITSITLFLLALWKHAIKNELPWAEQILPPLDSPVGTSAVLGEIVEDGGTVQLILRLTFQSKEPNEELAKIISTDCADLETLRRENFRRGAPLTPAFFEFYDELSSRTVFRMEEMFNSICNKLIFPCYIFSNNENMHRSFGQMNSLGVPLKSAELIKADLYGTAKAQQATTFGDTAATYWTENYETGFWCATIPKAKDLQLDRGLLRVIEEELNFPTAHNRGWHQEGKDVYTHWLAEQWRRRFADVGSEVELRALWDTITSGLSTFKNAFDETLMFKEGSRPWVIRELYYYLGTDGSGQTFSFILRILRAVPEEERDEALMLLMKYATAYWVSTTKSAVLLNVLNTKDSIFQERSFNLEDFSDYLKGIWPSKLEIASTLKSKSYSSDKDAAKLVRAFIYADNAIAASDPHDPQPLKSLKPLDKEWHREHILAVSDKNWPRKISEAQKARYAYTVNHVGNTFVLAGKKNSSLGDKSVEEKIKVYTQLPMTSSLVNWYGTFEHVYSKQNKWGPDEITERSRLLADFFSELLSFNGSLDRAKNLLIYPEQIKVAG